MEEILWQSGAFRRKPRKLTASVFLQGLLASVFEKMPTLEGIAGIFSLMSGLGYTKQAAQKRMNAGAVSFVFSLLQHMFQQMAAKELPRGLFTPFRRVLVQDSTAITLPKRYEHLYPGSNNQNGTNSVLKLQLIMEMISGSVAELSVSSYRRNDLAASRDIFSVARRGDLVLRDLGYFCAESFRRMDKEGIFFVSRLCGRIPVLDPETLEELELSRELEKSSGVFDRVMLIGKTLRIPVRMVALPVPAKVAQERRRKSYQNKDTRHPPSKERLRRMSWNIIITNVPSDVLSSEQIVNVYHFRWRIEIVFKAWKSMLALKQLNFNSEKMLHISLALKLLLCLFVHGAAFSLEFAARGGNRHVSMLRVARILKDFLPLIMAHLIGVSPAELLDFRLQRHAFYECRKDRKNFFASLYEPSHH